MTTPRLWLKVRPIIPLPGTPGMVQEDGHWWLHLRYVRSEASREAPYRLVWRCEYPDGSTCIADPAYVYGSGEGRLYLQPALPDAMDEAA